MRRVGKTVHITPLSPPPKPAAQREEMHPAHGRRGVKPAPDFAADPSTDLSWHQAHSHGPKWPLLGSYKPRPQLTPAPAGLQWPQGAPVSHGDFHVTRIPALSSPYCLLDPAARVVSIAPGGFHGLRLLAASKKPLAHPSICRLLQPQMAPTNSGSRPAWALGTSRDPGSSRNTRFPADPSKPGLPVHHHTHWLPHHQAPGGFLRSQNETE